MKEYPILFSGPMVRAILDGRKMQTRRAVKPQPAVGFYLQPMFGRSPCGTKFGTPGHFRECAPDYGDDASDDRFCPYGKPGDALWVKETWYCDHYLVQRGPFLEVDGAKEMLVYRADNHQPFEAEQPIWRPSIFMPRWASRITLVITSIRAERLQAISEEDAKAEGIFINDRAWQAWENGIETKALFPSTGYRLLWELINGGGSWAANPWVWVIEFKRV